MLKTRTAAEPQRLTLQAADGVALAIESRGDSAEPALVFAHGFGQTRHAWDASATALAEAGWHCLSMDARGHGDSGWRSDGHYDFPQFVDDLVQLARVPAEKPILVGASMGGLLGLVAQAEHEVFRALVLVDITPRVDIEGVSKIQAFMRANSREGFGSIAEAADAVAAYLPHRPRPRSHEGLKKNLRLHPDGRWRWHWDPRFLEGNRRIGAGSREVEQALVAAAKSVTIPALLVRGGSSELVQEEHAKDFVKLVPHATYVDVSGARHMVAGDRNDQFANAIEVFLRTVA